MCDDSNHPSVLEEIANGKEFESLLRNLINAFRPLLSRDLLLKTLLKEAGASASILTGEPYRPEIDIPGAISIARERYRQIAEKKYDAKNDDAYSWTSNPMLLAAMAYLETATYYVGALPVDYVKTAPPNYWPFERGFWKPKSPKEDLARAAALMAATMDQLDRLEIPELSY